MIWSKVPVLLLAVCPFSPIVAQSLEATQGVLDPDWALLLSASPFDLENDDQKAERIVDLVDVFTLDSVLDRRTERHQFFGAAMVRTIGLRWESVNHRRVKVVGRIRKQSMTRKEHFTEYDVNFTLVPHLLTSRNTVYAAYALRENLFKARKKVKPGQPPYIAPFDGQDEASIQEYDIHVECTPLRELRPALDSIFYPVLGPRPLSSHPSFDMDYPVIGFYGPLALDCNHTCGPEIHPYEWIWWRQAPASPGASWSWHVGLFRDASNRFRHWSSAPRTGQISLPVVWSLNSDTIAIRFEPGPHSEFNRSEWPEMTLPAKYSEFRENPTLQILGLPDGRSLTLKVRSSETLDESGPGFWFSDWTYDPSEQVVAARLHLAVGVEAVFTTAIYVE